MATLIQQDSLVVLLRILNKRQARGRGVKPIRLETRSEGSVNACKQKRVHTGKMYGICSTIQYYAIKKISVFRVTGLKSLGRVGTHIFFNYFFSRKNTILCILKGISPFKMHKIIFLSRKPEKNSRFHQ